MHNHSAHCSHRTTQPKRKVKLLTTALVLIFSFSLAELAMGRLSHSLALIADSGHMASDCFALVLALLGTWIAHRRNSNNSALGHHWAEVVAALANGIGLVAIALWVGWEALERLQSPSVEIFSLPMLATASVGLGVNSVNIFLLHQDSHDDLNLRGAFLHVLADAASSLGVILAAVAVWALNWLWADGVISLLVSGLIVVSATPLIVRSLKALLAKFPERNPLSKAILGKR